MPSAKSTATNTPEFSTDQDVHLPELPKESASDIEYWTRFEEALKALNTSFKKATFDEHLCKQAYELHRLVKGQSRPEASSYWKGLTLVYELNDMFNLDESINQDAFTKGQLVYNQLRELSLSYERSHANSDEERRLALEKVLYCACYGNELRRRGQAEAAAQVFDWLLSFTSTTLKTSALPCLGTRARLSYHLGYVYRVLERHNVAEDKFTQTLDLLYERSQSRKNDRDRLLILRRQAMVVGIGYGWGNLTRGYLERAEKALTTARSMLAGINDPIVLSFIELLYGTIKRCRAGTSTAKLEKAVRSLQAAKKSFENHGHRRHVTRACWELSLAYNLLGNFEEAEKNLNEVEQYAQAVNHVKWQINVLVLRSRLLRNQGDLGQAREQAEAAVRKALEGVSVLPLTDAYITRGEAFFKTIEAGERSGQSYELARKDFETALEKIGTLRAKQKSPSVPLNPKIVAVCELRIAQCYARDGNEVKARSHFATWEMLRQNVEHEWVRELAEDVNREIEDIVHNFSISAKDPRDWNYVQKVAELRNWLLTQALRYTNRNYSAAAELIGVKRGTLYQWQDDSRAQTQRARTKNRE